MNKNRTSERFTCEFSVKTYEFSPSIVTDTIGIEPIRFFNKGELIFSKHSKNPGEHQWGLWAYNTKHLKDELITLNEHILFLDNLLHKKMPELKKLKKEYKFETALWIRSESEDGVFGFDINKRQLVFLNKICDWVAFGIRCKAVF